MSLLAQLLNQLPVPACAPVVAGNPCRNVYWHKKNDAWYVQLNRNGKRMWRGYFKDYEDAVDARRRLLEDLENYA
jgi:hypothetical protein